MGGVSPKIKVLWPQGVIVENIWLFLYDMVELTFTK